MVQTTSPPSFHFASGRSSTGISIEVVADGLVFVQARVNGHPGWFILDNGTQGFVADREYARNSSLVPAGSVVTKGVGSDASRASVVHDVSIALPGLDLTHRSMVVIDLKSLEPVIGHVIDGIIGSRLFDDFVVVLNYEARQLSIFAPGDYETSGKETALPVRIDAHGFQYVDATITLAGAAPVSGSFLVDGGANYYASLYKPFADTHHLPPTGMKLEPAPADSQTREGRAERIGVGPYAIDHAPISFAQDAEGLMASKEYAGLIGAEFLQRFTVVFDDAGKRILLTANRSYEKPAEYDQSGLRIAADGNGFHRFTVTRIVPQSPASEIGLQAGDVLESIDGHFATSMTLSEVRTLLRRNARCALGILRGTKRFDVVLQLRPLL
jgi:hypothetical protein